MSVNFNLKVLAGAVALALGGTAMANTSIDVTATGDVVLNVVDATNNSSFLYDTGVSQAAFNGSGTYSFNVSTDANYKAFVAGEGAGDVIDYSLLSATRTTTTPNKATVLFTSNGSPAPVPGSNMAQAQTNFGGFIQTANAVTSTTTNSVLLGAVQTFGQNAYEVMVDTNLGLPYIQPGTGVDALVGTALNFYNESSSTLRAVTPAILSTYAGTWNFKNGVATYGGVAAVPLPTPLLLLLSGLGLMGVVTRRSKGTSDTSGLAAA